MQNLFSLQNLVWLFTLGGWAVAGVFIVIGFFGQSSKARREEADRLADGLIQRLNQTVEQQSKDIAQMQVDMEAHTKSRDEEIRKLSDDLKHMQGRNAVLEDLFKGRDPQMQNFLKDAPRLMQIAEHNNSLAQNTNEAIAALAGAMKTLVEKIDGDHLQIT